MNKKELSNEELEISSRQKVARGSNVSVFGM